MDTPLRDFFEAAPDAMLLVNARGEIHHANSQALQLFGYSAAELIKQSVDILVPNSARSGHTAQREAYMREPKTRLMGSGIELVGRRKDGSEFPVEISLSPMPMSDEQFVAAAVRDVSETRRMVRLLRDSQAYNRSLIESNIDALMTTDPLGIITDVNREMCEMTGQARDTLIGTPFNRYFTDPKEADAGIRKVLAEDRVTNYELTMRAANGKETQVSYNATTFRDGEGRLKGVFAAARDITVQKLLEDQIKQRNQALTEASTFLNNVLESSTEYSIIAKDLKGNILTWNEGARRNYGYTAEEMVGKVDSSLLHTPEDIASGRVQALLEQALTSGKAEGVFERRRKSGERFTASVSMTLRRDINGAPVGYLEISKDITEQKRMEEQLQRKNEELEAQYRRIQEANRLKSEFLANMSHELRTPLNAIIGFSELMHDGKVGPVSPDHKEYLGDILTSAKHLLQLINDVLDLAKVESGKMEFHPEQIDLTKVVGEVCDVLRALMSQKHINVGIEVDPALTQIIADPAKLKQVLYNYLSNALKFTPEGGKVVVRAQPEGAEHYRIAIEDSGIGIKPDDLQRLFVEFQQLDASLAKKYQGTGLGLALTKSIVEAQGGRVGVSSTFGHGSVFYAILPIAVRAEIEPKVDTSVTLANPDAPRVLIVEDNAQDSAWLQQLLQQEGYRVELANNGADALQCCRKQRFDAIVLDILLPDISGWEILKVIRAQGPNRRTPVIVASITSDAYLGQAFTIQDFLVKPVDRDEVLQALSQAQLDAAERNQVLVVDDDPGILKLMAKLLRDLGYRAATATDGAQALNLAQSQRPDAVILDLLMAGIDGFEFLSLFRQMPGCEEIPVMIWTAKDLTPNERAQLENAAQAVVHKGSQTGAAPLLNELRRHLPPPALGGASARAERLSEAHAGRKQSMGGDRHGG